MFHTTLLEICCPTVESAVIAQECGVDRIELCSDLSCGGITPSKEEISEARRELQIPVHVLVRCRAGNFVYTESEVQEMIQQIEFCKSQKVNGVVIGALTSENGIDTHVMRKLVSSAKPMHITFHRAFDEVEDPLKALNKLFELDVNQILTSGQQSNAVEGVEYLKRFVELSKGRLTILAGGGIRSNNLLEIIEKCGVSAVHTSARVMEGKDVFRAEIHKIRALLAENVRR
eukprot:TRINITY_DN16484_c0_g1_i1.p1 TRINITY_DN16484_c0_g1~~TRINITY_DN16484_c0_g1_i1.p1  ORF type:complete len:231 (-),score=54.73 TRINITY_DN16484_c0_g1_i1:42-734(-)